MTDTFTIYAHPAQPGYQTFGIADATLPPNADAVLFVSLAQYAVRDYRATREPQSCHRQPVISTQKGVSATPANTAWGFILRLLRLRLARRA